MVPLGIQFATSANVGQQIGSGNIPMAKKHAITHVSFAIFIMTIIMVCIKIFEQGVARIFTEDPEDVLAAWLAPEHEAHAQLVKVTFYETERVQFERFSPAGACLEGGGRSWLVCRWCRISSNHRL